MLEKIKRVTTIILLATPLFVSAHEAYVLPKDFFWREMSAPFSWTAFTALEKPGNLGITVEVVCGVLILLLLNYLFRKSRVGKKVSNKIESISTVGPVFVRLAIAAAFFFSAYSGSFLGPELSSANMPYAVLISPVLYVLSGLIFLGLFTQLAAAIALVLYTAAFFTFGTYIFTYLNYLGEIIVLLLFGLDRWSIDSLISRPMTIFFPKLLPYKTTIVRVLYGIALVYAGLTVKFLHPELTVRVAIDWNLMQFHWLFPADPLLITLGAGIAEIAIGLFIVFGFELRLTVLISLFYITLSLIYFRELVWPHLMLYGISINLILEPEIFTIDNLLFRKDRGKI